MVRKLIIATLFVLVGMQSSVVLAEDRGTPEQAIALVDRAIARYNEVGREKAFAEFNDSKGAFVDRDMYVLVSDFNAVFLAHGVNRGLINKNLSELKDVNGRFIVREMVEAAKTKPNGSWVEYVWTNPTTKKLDPKKTWIKAVGDIFIGVGVYDQSK
ncbi:Histidine kinase [uncultured Gammaproteobacteria bacterium]